MLSAHALTSASWVGQAVLSAVGLVVALEATEPRFWLVRHAVHGWTVAGASAATVAVLVPALALVVCCWPRRRPSLRVLG